MIQTFNHILKRSLVVSYSTVASSFSGQYTLKQEERILNLLNEVNQDVLLKHNFTLDIIKQLRLRLQNVGPFRTLYDVLEVEGINGKILDDVCASIIGEKKTAKRNLLTPVLNQVILAKFQSAIGMHLSPTGLSWAKITKDSNEVTDWSYYDFMNLPKKMTSHENFSLVQKVLEKLPSASVYIMEGASSSPSPNSKQVSTYSQQMELSSMLLALLNTSKVHNIIDEINTVYFLRSRTPARMFKTLIGNEQVSSTGIIHKIIDWNSELPCSKVVFKEDLIRTYNTYSSGTKNLLGQALLLTIAFMDLAVHKNPVALNALTTKHIKRNK